MFKIGGRLPAHSSSRVSEFSAPDLFWGSPSVASYRSEPAVTLFSKPATPPLPVAYNRPNETVSIMDYSDAWSGGSTFDSANVLNPSNPASSNTDVFGAVNGFIGGLAQTGINGINAFTQLKNAGKSTTSVTPQPGVNTTHLMYAGAAIVAAIIIFRR